MAWDTRITPAKAHFLTASPIPHDASGHMVSNNTDAYLLHSNIGLRGSEKALHWSIITSGVALTLRIRKQLTGDGSW